MPKDLTRENVPVGTIQFAWEVSEYDKYQRGLLWYAVMGLIGIALVAYSIWSGNYLFALVVVLFGIVLYLHEMQTPLQVPFAITTLGIVLGRKFYRYNELKNFWIIYRPGQTKNIYFALGGVLRHRLQVPLLDSDPLPIRDHLLQYLPEDLEQEEEPITDRLARLLKIH